MAPSKTKHESLEFVFGDPLQSFDPNIKPTTFSVIKHWIYHYDGVRGSKRLGCPRFCCWEYIMESRRMQIFA